MWRVLTFFFSTAFEKRQIRNSVNAPVMTDKDGNVKAFDAANVYLPSQGQRRNKKFRKA